LAFEDPFHDYINKGYKGQLEEGNDPERAIANLKDHNPKGFAWGRYEFSEFDGRGKSVLVLTNPQQQKSGYYRWNDSYQIYL